MENVRNATLTAPTIPNLAVASATEAISELPVDASNAIPAVDSATEVALADAQLALINTDSTGIEINAFARNLEMAADYQFN